ncbi:condensin complex subunit 3 isoform 2-T2 [Discoglossus pictus]
MTEGRGLQIKEAFDLSQKPHQSHAKLISRLRITYNAIEDKSIFLEEFIHFLKYPLIVYRREPAVERVIDFVAKFVTSFHKPETEDDEDETDEENSPVNYLFTFLLQSHNASSMAVRFRVCQLINKLLVNLPENAQIDDDLFDKIHDAMIERLKDKVPNVRIQAVLALARLQDPGDENCPVSNSYMHLIENDSSAEVRRAVLSCIAPSAKSLPKIVGRTMDVKELVRKLAYQVLSEKVHMRALTIAQRVKLLQQGLNDRSGAVKEVIQKKLLQAWLKFTEGDVLELLHRLDVENSPEVALSALNTMFSLSPVSELAQNCKNIDEKKLIPLQTLTPENVLYWRALCEYLKSTDDEGETALESILPEPAVYAEYLKSYLLSLPVLTEEQKADITKIEDLMTKEFISQQLILIIGCLDTSEEGGRKRLLAVLQEILVLPNTPTSLISPLVELLLRVLKEDDRRVLTVAEIISELREPIVTVDNPKAASETRKLQLKIADVKVQLIETKQALEDCIAVQDFSRASELKEKNDPETLLKCLIMCNELLKHMSLSKGLGGTINEIIESLILPGITNVHPSVRNMAVLCIGCCALQNIDFARRHLALLLQISQLDEVKVKISALNSIFDMLLMFGMEILKAKKDDGDVSRCKDDEITPEEKPDSTDQDKTTEDATEETATVNGILQLFSSFLDSEISEIRTETAEGLAKLMFSGRLISAKLLSRLILLWYNPVTEEDTKLRHCLGVFFPIYAFSCRTNQECFEEAYFSTLQTLFNAPASSPLADVDIGNVAELLIDLTRPSGLNQKNKMSQDYEGCTVHDNMALKICNDILKDPTAPDVRIYTKSLCSLEISKDYSKELLPYLDSILEEVTDKVSEKAVEKLRMQLKVSSGLTEEPEISHEKEPEISHEKEPATNEQQNEEDGIAKETSEVFEEQTIESTKPNPGKAKSATGRRKGSATTRRKPSKAVEEETESDNQGDEQPIPVNVRPSRRAKTAAMEKTKMNLTSLLNREVNQ